MKEKIYIIQVNNKEDIDKLNGSSLATTILSEKKIQVTTNYPYNEFFNLLGTCDVIGLEARQESLEDVFMKYYGEVGVSNE